MQYCCLVITEVDSHELSKEEPISLPPLFEAATNPKQEPEANEETNLSH
jgi:hypothetical protein